MGRAVDLIRLVKSVRVAWKLTREEFLKSRIPLVKKLEPLVKRAEKGELVEFSLKELDKSLPNLKVCMYCSKVSKFPTSYDDVRKMIYINLDTPSDFVEEVLRIRDKTLQAFYALMHELGHHNLRVRGLPYVSALGDEVEIAASADVDALWRKLLREHELAVREAVRSGRRVPARVLAEYPRLRGKV
ncbi:MAG: hypothetical protein DRO14_03080 [Thermoprotei archaeon]|nr:MAG: hypothetical protein DRO14_03080 [Thermoprotei archaeon]